MTTTYCHCSRDDDGTLIESPSCPIHTMPDTDDPFDPLDYA